MQHTEVNERLGTEPKMHPRRRKQAGVSLIQILIAVVITAALTVVLFQETEGQRAEAEMQAAVGFVTTTVPTGLTSYFYSRNRSYDGIRAGDEGAMQDRFGWRADMPWGDDWTITAANNTSVTFSFPCTNMRSDESCQQFADSVDSYDGDLLMLDRTRVVDDAVEVRYDRPR